MLRPVAEPFCQTASDVVVHGGKSGVGTLPSGRQDAKADPAAGRDTLFFLKSSTVDDEFALWLAPKLEVEGYCVFADILTIQPGDRWRREINRRSIIALPRYCRSAATRH